MSPRAFVSRSAWPGRRGARAPATGRPSAAVMRSRRAARVGPLGAVALSQLERRREADGACDVLRSRPQARAPGRRRARSPAGRRCRGRRGRPMPFGPPSLCAASVTVTSPGSRPISTRTPEGACTASRCSGTPRSAQMAATASTGWTTPVTLFAHITQASASPGRTRSAKAPRSSTPSASTGAQTTSHPRAARARTGSRTAGCSMALATTRPARPAVRPWIAMLSDSEPPPVKTTSCGATPSTPATRARASERPARAARPAQCGSEALPNRSVKNGSMASSTAGARGVVAAWSR